MILLVDKINGITVKEFDTKEQAVIALQYANIICNGRLIIVEKDQQTETGSSGKVI